MSLPSLYSFRPARLCLALVCSLLVATILEGCGNSPGPSPSPKPTLPSTMIAGYTSGASVENITQAVKRGVNVIFWSFLELEANALKGGVKSSTVGPVYEALVKENRKDVLHFVSFGGWNVAHTLAGTCGETECSGQAYAEYFRSWNEQMKSNISGFPGFAGIDWDLEGVNDWNSSSNEFDLPTFEIMMDMSKALRDDFLISMVPPQSYFNCKESGFDMSLRHSAESMPSFKYAGLNAYALLFAKCQECFDLVMVQLYEGYSPAGFDLYWEGNASHVGSAGWPREGTDSDMKKVIHNNMECLANGWRVDFNGFWNMSNQTVVVPASKIVIGLANGWAGPFKFPFFGGKPSGEAWCEGVTAPDVDFSETTKVRGFAYWDIHDDNVSISLVSNLHSAMTSCSNKSSIPRSIAV